MAGVKVFLDPSCAWSWITSRWITEVAPQRDLTVRWRSYCCEIRDDYGPAPAVPEQFREAAINAHAVGHRMLRMFEAARARAGEDAVDALYAEWGHRFFAGGPAPTNALFSECLTTCRLDADLLDAADEEKWDAPIVNAMEVAYAFGGPKTPDSDDRRRRRSAPRLQGTGDGASHPGHLQRARILRAHTAPHQLSAATSVRLSPIGTAYNSNQRKQAPERCRVAASTARTLDTAGGRTIEPAGILTLHTATDCLGRPYRMSATYAPDSAIWRRQMAVGIAGRGRRTSLIVVGWGQFWPSAWGQFETSFPLGGEPLGDGLARAAGTTRDEHDASSDVHHGFDMGPNLNPPKRAAPNRRFSVGHPYAYRSAQ